ncbi:hypothetical protein BDN72DRAFT_841986 [Pluteus cervinus]|uniref:Uncharacterized protein n=1 Tax=Pluteus cervinus TaxID=181527 RepID=A0ACD3ASS6_9AGAR|nr:hypothetical protein BDN72DRAFT_841986 [Pluteus cervinus]
MLLWGFSPLNASFCSLTFSFTSPTTSGRGVKDTPAIGMILELQDLDRVWIKDSDEGRNSSNRHPRGRSEITFDHHGSKDELENIWELLDWWLCSRCDELPSFREVVIGLRQLKGDSST